MSSMSLWINTVVSVLGVLVGAFLAMGSVISIANMQISWSGALLVSAMLVPVAFARFEVQAVPGRKVASGSVARLSAF